MILLPQAAFSAPDVRWAALVPVLIVLGTAVLSVLVEAFAPVRARRPIVIGLALFATGAAAAVLALRWTTVLAAPASLGEYIEDPLTVGAQFVLAIIGFLSVLVMADRTRVGDGSFAAQPSDRPGSAAEELSEEKGYQRSEVFPLALFSLGGMMVFPAADNFVALFVALEVMSLPLYVLAATARRRRQLSHEAALKYFVLGAFSSAFMLMGAALLFGASNSLTISALAQAIGASVAMDRLVLIGVLCVMIGLLFKVGAAPFHAWAPDVYTGAPTPVTGFMAAAVKVAAFGAALRFYQVVAGLLSWDLLPVFLAVAAATIVVGTFVGLVQSDVKRMLAFSSIAHAGFILIGVFSLVKGSSGHVLLYVLSYGLATVGAFGVVTLVRTRDQDGAVGGEANQLSRWAGLGRTNPWVAASMLVFLLSFAGIPLTGGFIGKFVVFSDGAAGGLAWLVAVALVASAVTAFYYFRLVRLMFFTEPEGNAVVVRSEGLTGIAVAVCAVATIALGVFPGPVLSQLSKIVILLP